MTLPYHRSNNMAHHRGNGLFGSKEQRIEEGNRTLMVNETVHQ